MESAKLVVDTRNVTRHVMRKPRQDRSLLSIAWARITTRSWLMVAALPIPNI